MGLPSPNWKSTLVLSLCTAAHIVAQSATLRRGFNRKILQGSATNAIIPLFLDQRPCATFNAFDAAPLLAKDNSSLGWATVQQGGVNGSTGIVTLQVDVTAHLSDMYLADSSASREGGNNVRVSVMSAAPAACPTSGAAPSSAVLVRGGSREDCSRRRATVRVELPPEVLNCTSTAAEEFQVPLFVLVEMDLAGEVCGPPRDTYYAGSLRSARAAGCSYINVTAACVPATCDVPLDPAIAAAALAGEPIITAAARSKDPAHRVLMPMIIGVGVGTGVLTLAVIAAILYLRRRSRDSARLRRKTSDDFDDIVVAYGSSSSSNSSRSSSDGTASEGGGRGARRRGSGGDSNNDDEDDELNFDRPPAAMPPAAGGARGSIFRSMLFIRSPRAPVGVGVGASGGGGAAGKRGARPARPSAPWFDNRAADSGGGDWREPLSPGPPDTKRYSEKYSEARWQQYQQEPPQQKQRPRPEKPPPQQQRPPSPPHSQPQPPLPPLQWQQPPAPLPPPPAPPQQQRPPPLLVGGASAVSGLGHGIRYGNPVYGANESFTSAFFTASAAATPFDGTGMDAFRAPSAIRQGSVYRTPSVFAGAVAPPPLPEMSSMAASTAARRHGRGRLSPESGGFTTASTSVPAAALDAVEDTVLYDPEVVPDSSCTFINPLAMLGGHTSDEDGGVQPGGSLTGHRLAAAHAALRGTAAMRAATAVRRMSSFMPPDPGEGAAAGGSVARMAFAGAQQPP